ncbi:ankyrin repeat-containing protein [Fusarium beomiforme]|uniref:Ankyrin repeat-containing protein n=1 Tax=Fusarium beomiforme TaxID=44412 RepID=A0A9P5DVI4_9HYPO|nr:ankyrin repeat-containing protein [Fusarium beomiforme]
MPDSQEGMDSRQTDIKTEAAGTCHWLLQHKEYKRWESRDQSMLWIKGKPGSGKSTLLRYARHNIPVARRDEDVPLVLSFFFNGRGIELQKTPEGMFRSLLCQLQSELPKALKDLKAAFKRRVAVSSEHSQNWEWDTAELRHYFQSSLWEALKTRPVLLFIDALDEAGLNNAQTIAEELSSLLQRASVGHLKQLRICFTCRHYPILDLRNALEICLDHENKSDISTFVRSKLYSFQKRTGSTIADFISENSAGVFLWSVLVTNRVLELELKCISIESIEAEVRMIPQTLNEFYSELIRNMEPDSAGLIEFIAFAIRPLSIAELRWALILENDSSQSLKDCEIKSKYTSREEGMKWQILRLGCGLVEYEPATGIVQFMHQSVMDFFVDKVLPSLRGCKEPGQVAVSAHYRLAEICLRYMAMQDFDQPANEPDITSKFPFLRYAVTSWILHAVRISEDLQESIPWPLSAAVDRWLDLARQLNYVQSRGLTLLPMISIHGLTGALRFFLKAGIDQLGSHINVEDSWGRTPLYFASQFGRVAIVELLLDNGAQTDITNASGLIPLCAAIERRSSQVVDLLLKRGAKVNYHYIAGHEPVLLAESGRIR